MQKLKFFIIAKVTRKGDKIQAVGIEDVLWARGLNQEQVDEEVACIKRGKYDSEQRRVTVECIIKGILMPGLVGNSTLV